MDLPIENFRKLFGDFLADLDIAYPELNDNIKNINSLQEKLSDEEFVADMMSVLEENQKYIEEEDDLFFSNIDDKSLLGKLNLRNIWNKEDNTDNNKESIWKYLQTLLVVGAFIKNTGENITNLVEKLSNNEDNEIGDTIKKQANILGDVFSNFDPSKMTGSDSNGENVIMKLAEEMSNDIQSGKSGINPEDIMKSMMSGDTSSMVNMIEHIGSQIHDKINSGEIDQNQLINQAKSMAETLGKDPNLSKLAGSINQNQNMDFSGILNSVSGLMNKGQGGSNPLSSLFGGEQNDDSEMPDLDQIKKNARSKTKRNIVDKRRHKK